jgi:hypothetical protein
VHALLRWVANLGKRATSLANSAFHKANQGGLLTEQLIIHAVLYRQDLLAEAIVFNSHWMSFLWHF